MNRHVFVTGGSGYMGQQLLPLLVQRGHHVTALVRPGGMRTLAKGVRASTGDALKMDSYTDAVGGADTFVHLIGVPHPSPAKAAQFRSVDLVSAKVALKAAADAGIQHFVYLSVAHPASMMKAFIEVRRECEEMIRASGLNATFLRPWYVLGPGHRWAYTLLPFYWLCERLPATRDSARRLGLVRLPQMIGALLWSVENPADGVRIIEVPQIRQLGAALKPDGTKRDRR
jgi:uncharacterized protein YbjT (DUF2867 family)